MGMFDYVNYECVCPVCHSSVTNFQSKSGDCDLETVDPKSVSHFYAACTKCGCWIDYTAQEITNFKRTVIGKDHKQLSEHDKDVLIK